VRREIRRVDPDQPLTEVRSLDAAIRNATAEVWVAAGWIMGLGAIALVLAAVGIYGLTSYSVSQRTTEVGIRLALGARPGQVVAQIVAENSRLAAIGLAAGLLAAWALAHGMARLLTFIEPDAGIFAVVALGLAAVAAVSSYVPARRAAQIDPVQSLRRE
jgi:putative ABC transport system permease protein